MERQKTIQMNVRVQPWVRDAIRAHAESAHGHGVLVEKAIDAYVQQLKQSGQEAYWKRLLKAALAEQQQ